MRLLAFAFISIFFIQFSYAQFWDPWSVGRCYGRYEQYKQCATTCPDTCEDVRRYNPAKICTMMCRTGCECIPPFVRQNQYSSSPCVHPYQCRYWY